jgi:hypothetical protein
MSGNISLAGFVGRVLLVEQEAMARANRHLQPIGYLYPNTLPIVAKPSRASRTASLVSELPASQSAITRLLIRFRD